MRTRLKKPDAHDQVVVQSMNKNKTRSCPVNDTLRAAVCIIAVILTVCLLISPASAHSPSDMTLSYNENTRDLQVKITHPVPNPQVHYIREVTVAINGKAVNTSTYTSQPAPDTITYTYPVEVSPGDDIEVVARCNLAGSISRHLSVATAAAPSPAALPGTQKAAAGLAPILGAAALVLLIKK